ncbi:hypothetical protein E8E14_002076 [Neopestalotiopsis sp. 37M]|nr:hypothetical protein E8E14_002076 [Neopestalotiopsis sp. 37M]
MAWPESLPWQSTPWEAPSASNQQPQPIRFGNHDYMLVPISQGGGLQQQIWTQRSELQRFDSESLKKVNEYRYKRLKGGKKRIRLVQLMSGETQSQDIFCEFIEAEYDKRFHVPVRIQTDKRLGTATEKQEPPIKLPVFYEDQGGNISDVTKQQRRDYENERYAELKQRRKAAQDRLREAKTDSEAEDESEGGADMQFHQDLDEVTKNKIAYEALSWCWGIDEPKFVVKIIERGKTFKLRVKRELALALKYLRLPDRARTLWIDAICINQEDPEERNHQVQMMSRIYTRAERVCVWLGEDTPDSKVAIDFIREEIMELKNFDTVCSDKRYTQQWQALMMLMQAPWFSRRWVIQEIALAREAEVYCGKDSIPWKEFAVAVELFVEVETATHRLSEIMQKDEKFRHVPGWFEYVSELGASLLVQATGKVFRAQRTLEQDSEESQKQSRKALTIDPLERRSLLSLEFLVSTMFIFKATEPRDAVYSLLAIARDAAPFAEASFSEDDPSSLTMTLFDTFLEEKRFPIDYNRPYSDVCRDFVRFVIKRKSKLDPIQALDILCRPWALAQPKKKSKIVVQNDSKNSDRSYKKERSFPEPSQIWKIRQCEIKHTVAANNQDKWKMVKKSNDKWVEDPRSTSQYVEKIKEQKIWHTSGIATSWRAPTGWKDYETWCTEYSNLAKATAAAKESAKSESKTKIYEDDDDQNHDRDVKVEEESDLELPSWVAQASRAPITLDYHPGMKFLKTGRANADPLVGQPFDGHRNYNAAQTRPVNLDILKFRKRPNLGHHSMFVQGFELDEVVEIEDASQGGDIPVAWLRLGGWEEGEDGFIADPPDRLWRTLVADRGRDNRNPPYYYARACRESVHKGSISSGRVDTAALINNERNSIVAEFCRRVHAVIWNRRMFITKKKRLGLAFNVEKGDKVCILYGCTVPIILRTHKKDPGDLSKEKFEDGKEALIACIRQWEKNCERKLSRLSRNAENKKKWINSGEWAEMMEAKEKAEERLGQDAAKEERLQAESRNHEGVNGHENHSVGPDRHEEDVNPPLARVQEAQISDEDPPPATGNNSGEGASIEDSQLEPASNQFLVSRDVSSRGYHSPSQPDNADGTPGALGKNGAMTFYERQAVEAKEKDPHRFYTFQGDCYLHGMMDGEAMREKFYRELPDRVFELR